MLQEIDTGVYIENYGISNNLLYADDICIYGFSACALTRMLQTCQEWATMHGDFEFSAEKSLIYLLFSVYKYIIIVSGDEDGLIRVAEVI